MNTDEFKLPDGRVMSEMTQDERAEFERVKETYEGDPLTADELKAVTGGLTFRETKWDRFRLHTYAFFNGQMDVMMQIQIGTPLADISWRP